MIAIDYGYVISLGSFEGLYNSVHLSLDVLNSSSSVEVLEVTFCFVVSNNRESLLVETVKALAKGFSSIVLSVEERFSCDVILAFLFGRIESKVVRASTIFMYTTATNALLKDFLVTVKSYNKVHLLSTLGHNFIELLSLLDSPWESIKQKSAT